MMESIIGYDHEGRIFAKRGYEVALARLAAYEDIKLIPDQARELIKYCHWLIQDMSEADKTFINAGHIRQLFYRTGLLERKDSATAEQRAKIIAVDFDGTLAENEFPDIGKPIESTINRLKEEQRNGAKVILWTCRHHKELEDAIRWCLERGICFNAVNENLPETIEHFGHNTRKIYANEYWDDKAVAVREEQNS